MKLKSIIDNAKTTVDSRPSKSHTHLVVAALAIAMVLLPEVALAGGGGGATPWATTADSVRGIFTGGLSRTIAIIAVIACGIAALAGKLSWDWAVKIIVGIVLIFGSATVVDLLITASSGGA
jgi:type IV secretory pathway VirB2 component (pilin)